MGEKIFGWFEKIATGEKRRYFFATLIIIVILGIIVFPYIDANFLYYNRIEKRIDNLSNLVNLTDTPLEENVILYKEYLNILEEMQTARENSLFASNKAEVSRTDSMWKFAGGALLWVIIAIVLFFSKKKGEQRTFKQFINNVPYAALCLMIGVILGGVFVFIPTIGIAELNFALAPIVEIIVMWLIIESPKSKSKED